ncbi:hypothetical protein AYO38_06640 [bacterium SCGC AG-212-C10]|nr:hypothetical protein AYO38_06640 [bacterium SCGC AG-212-C10]
MEQEPDNLAGDFTTTSRKISELADAVAGRVNAAVEEIDHINATTRLLTLNAQIEAARAGGSSGAAFGVVASAMKDLSDQASQVSSAIARDTSQAIAELQRTNHRLRTAVRGTRLADLALTNIDLIDRNLYERSCDVRWWATDSSCVDALAQPSQETSDYASRRLGTILNAYTVYHDIVLCALDGLVVANGRPQNFGSINTNQASQPWFKAALATATGDEFGFQTVHPSALVRDQRALVYSCAVREGGDVKGRPLGVLGIVFNWDSLANGVIANTPLDSRERNATRICITDADGHVLADSSNELLRDQIAFPGRESLYRQGTAHIQAFVDGRETLIGHAFSPGYETYSSGWHSVIMEAL